MHIFSSKAIRILLSTNALIRIAGFMLGPIYALFVGKIGGDLLDASLTMGVFALAAGITSLIMGKLSDKVKENELIVVFGYGLMGVGYFLYLFVDSILFLFAVQVIIGFAEAAYAPAFDSLYSKHLSRGHAGREWGAWEAMNYFTWAGGAVLGGFIVSLFGFSALFITMALSCFVGASYIYYLPRKVL